MDKYERQGSRAFALGDARESCRYKKAQCREAWLRGWDGAADRKARRDAEARRVRWESYGGNCYSTPPREPSEYNLRGDAPDVRVHGQSYARGVWFVSCHQWGIDSEQLEATDPEDAKREAIATVARIARERLAKLESIAAADGRLLNDASEESEAQP